jgi:hypothetical protein
LVTVKNVVGGRTERIGDLKLRHHIESNCIAVGFRYLWIRETSNNATPGENVNLNTTMNCYIPQNYT